jgi:hypothetical protein
MKQVRISKKGLMNTAGVFGSLGKVFGTIGVFSKSVIS